MRVNEAAVVEQLSLNVLSSAPLPIIACSGDDRVIVFNHAAETLTGWEAKTILGGSLAKMIPPDLKYDHSASFAKAKDMLLAGGAEWSVPIVKDASLTRADGQAIPVRLTIRGAKAGDRVMFVAVLQPIIIEEVEDEDGVSQRSVLPGPPEGKP
jgi:PAS domain S-box-containing protein